MTTDLNYAWIDNWAVIPDTASGRENGRTHGVCVTNAGHVIVFHQAENGLLTYDQDGKLISAVGGDRWLGAHGLTRIEEDGQEYLWLVDQESREVAKCTLAGETVQTIERAPHEAYENGGYTPTWAAPNPQNGDIWVADGYGSSLVHRYSSAGTYISTLDGTEGAGRFRCPHGINFLETENGPLLYITDRGNSRVVVYNGEGTFLKQSTATHSPCCFDFWDDFALVPELMTGVKVLHASSLELVTEEGASEVVTFKSQPDGWPNLAGTPLVKSGQFNSPHGACFARNGDIYCVEWIIGGRITKLQRR